MSVTAEQTAEFEVALNDLDAYQRVEFYADAYKTGVVDAATFKLALRTWLAPKESA